METNIGPGAPRAGAEGPRIIELPKILDERGNLSFIEARKHIPFDIKRVYWIYDVPGGAVRGAHAFRKNRELIVALSGSFEVAIGSGDRAVRYKLNRSYFGLYVPERSWRFMEDFSTNSVAMVLASEPFSEQDYIRDRALLSSDEGKS